MKVLFTNCSFSQTQLQELQSYGIEILNASDNISEKDLIEKLQECEGYIIGGNDSATTKVIECTNLRIINFYGTGYHDRVDVNAATKKNIIVANTPKANAYSVAEFTVALILACVKNIVFLNNSVKSGNWANIQTTDLKNKTLGIIGMGTIGYYVAEMMKLGFKMNIVYYNRTKKPEVEEKLGAKKLELLELFKVSDVISLNTALVPELTNMLSNKEFEVIKNGAVLVNTSRAKLVDENALNEALSRNKIKMAAFDGYYNEPQFKPFSEESLINLGDDKFIITPHNAYNTIESFDNMNKMVMDNLIAFVTNKDIPYKVK